MEAEKQQNYPEYSLRRPVTHDNVPDYVGMILESSFRIEKRLNLLEQRLPELPIPKENLPSGEARTFLRTLGYSITETTMNKKCSLGEIPYRLIGKRRVFSREQLHNWVQQGCPNVRQLEASDRIANSLNK